MSLDLPADIEPFLGPPHSHDRIRGPAVYALRLTRPDNIGDRWDRVYDHRPNYWADLVDASGVVYVGAAKDLLARLNDHNDADVRQIALSEVCTIAGLRNVWWVDNANRRFIEESQIATMLQNERPDLYVHSR